MFVMEHGRMHHEKGYRVGLHQSRSLVVHLGHLRLPMASSVKFHLILQLGPHPLLLVALAKSLSVRPSHRHVVLFINLRETESHFISKRPSTFTLLCSVASVVREAQLNGHHWPITASFLGLAVPVS